MANNTPFPRMPFKLVLCAALIFFMSSPAFPEGPSESYARACRLMAAAARSGSPDGERMHREALEILTEIQRNNPVWNAFIVEYRIKECRSRIDGPGGKEEEAPGSAEGGTREDGEEEVSRGGEGERQPGGEGKAPRVEESGTDHGEEGDMMDPVEMLAGARQIEVAEIEIREREVSSATSGEGTNGERFPPALITFRKVRANRSRSYSRDAVEHYERAGDMLRQKDYNEAIGELREAIYLEGDYVEAYLALGEIYEMAGEDAIALEAYHSALGIDDDTAGAHCGIGNILICEGTRLERGSKLMEAWAKYQNAVMEYKRATWIDIDCVPAYYGIGVAYSKLGRHSDAAYYWKKTMEAGGEDSEYGSRAASNLAVTSLAP